MSLKATSSMRGRIQGIVDFVAGMAVILTCAVVAGRLLGLGLAPTPPQQAGQSSVPLPNEPVSFTDFPIDGDAQAPIGIIQFADFECPYCGRFARETLPELRSQYFATGRGFLAFAQLPLEGIHPHALEAATAAKCAQDRGRFWPFHDQLFSQAKPALDEGSLIEAFRAVGLPTKSWVECRSSGTLARVKHEATEAQRFEVRSTPTFFFGLSTDDGRLKVTHRFSGALPSSAFASIFKELESQNMATIPAPR